MSVLREIAQKVKELLDDLETLQQEEQTEDLEYPFEIGDTCFFINVVGEPAERKWSNYVMDKQSYAQGNIFKTRKEANKESDRRALLTRFKQFRDKCNGDWKPDLSNTKYYIYLDCDYLMLNIFSSMIRDAFNLFGYFKNKEDCQRAIELFGDEIKRLYVEE